MDNPDKDIEKRFVVLQTDYARIGGTIIGSKFILTSSCILQGKPDKIVAHIRGRQREVRVVDMLKAQDGDPQKGLVLLQTSSFIAPGTPIHISKTKLTVGDSVVFLAFSKDFNEKHTLLGRIARNSTQRTLYIETPFMDGHKLAERYFMGSMIYINQDQDYKAIALGSAQFFENDSTPHPYILAVGPWAVYALIVPRIGQHF